MARAPDRLTAARAGIGWLLRRIGRDGEGAQRGPPQGRTGLAALPGGDDPGPGVQICYKGPDHVGMSEENR